MTMLESMPYALETNPNQSENLEQVQQQLVDGAQEAYKSITFDSKNTRMANTVSTISAELASRALDIQGEDQQAAVNQAFLSITKVAGNKFAAAFTESGLPITENEALYKAAMKGPVAAEPVVENLPALLEALGNTANFNEVIQQANFQDILQIVSQELQVPVSSVSSAELIAMLHQVIPSDDYFAKNIDTTPTMEHAAFSADQSKALNLALRGTNATWMIGQVHRAAWEGTTDRINPDKREAFNPYDLMKQKMYQGLLDKGLTPSQAIIRVAFEVDKDRDVLNRTVQAKLAEAAAVNP